MVGIVLIVGAKNRFLLAKIDWADYRAFSRMVGIYVIRRPLWQIKQRVFSCMQNPSVIKAIVLFAVAVDKNKAVVRTVFMCPLS